MKMSYLLEYKDNINALLIFFFKENIIQEFVIVDNAPGFQASRYSNFRTSRLPSYQASRKQNQITELHNETRQEN